MQQLIEKGVEAISINPINVDAKVRAANEAGIPVFMHNFITSLSDPDAKVTAYVGCDQWVVRRSWAFTPAICWRFQ